jgi:hypothetical protein
MHCRHNRTAASQFSLVEGWLTVNVFVQRGLTKGAKAVVGSIGSHQRQVLIALYVAIITSSTVTTCTPTSASTHSLIQMRRPASRATPQSWFSMILAFVAVVHSRVGNCLYSVSQVLRCRFPSMYCHPDRFYSDIVRTYESRTTNHNDTWPGQNFQSTSIQ